MNAPLKPRLISEFIGTAFLLAAVIGSGIMGVNLAQGNTAVALMANAVATGAILIVLITILGPVSGAHFNPLVSAAMAWRGAMTWADAGLYTACQATGGCAGVLAAHAMFDLPLFQVSGTARAGAGLWLAEIIATAGLLLTIFGCIARAPAATPLCVGLYITSAYWFTASTSFANPAVTFARMFSDTFAGIAPASAPAFMLAQCAGLAAALALAKALWPDEA